MQDTDESILQVKVHTMYGSLYEGPAQSLSAANSLGPFDVLPGHANMLAFLTDCKLVVIHSQNHTEFPIKRAILRVTNNIIDVLINA